MITIFISALLTENIILTNSLGMELFFNASSREKNIMKVEILLFILTIISTTFTYLINKFMLIPINAIYLQTISFVIVNLFIVKVIELVLRKYFKNSYEIFNCLFPLLSINCVVFKIILTNINENYTIIESLIYSLGSLLGFILVLHIFSLLKEKIEKNKNILKSFKRIPIALIALGIMALIFQRL